MRTRNFQELSDFCRYDMTYRSYYDLPPWASQYPSRKKYDYYHRPFAPRDVSRAGTFIYYQAQKQLCRFLGVKELMGLHAYVARTSDGFRKVDRKEYNKYERWNSFIVFARMDEKGVRIHFDHPFGWNYESITFYARSHRPFNEEGIFEEAMAYIDKHILFPKGRYRDLQLRACKTKNEFVRWYHSYRQTEKERAQTEHEAMLDKYMKKREPMSYQECYAALALSGLFEDVGADRFERHELACEFMDIMNR